MKYLNILFRFLLGVLMAIGREIGVQLVCFMLFLLAILAAYWVSVSFPEEMENTLPFVSYWALILLLGWISFQLSKGYRQGRSAVHGWKRLLFDVLSCFVILLSASLSLMFLFSALTFP